MIHKYFEIRCDVDGCNAFDHFGAGNERAAIARAKAEGWEIGAAIAKCPSCAATTARPAPAGNESEETR